MKLALIQCPVWDTKAPPLAIASLTSYIRKRGYEVFPFDFNIKLSKKNGYKLLRPILQTSYFINSNFFQNLISKLYKNFILYCEKEILNTKAEIIGFVCYQTSVLFSLILAKRLKEKGKIIIFGGPECSRSYLKGLRYIDFLVLGEGEKALENILESLKKNEKPKIKNVPLLDLNKLPFPDFSDLNIKEYNNLIFPISGSRGCINKCSFCKDTNYWNRFRFKSAKRIFKEIQMFKYKYGVNKFLFTDSLVNSNLKELEKLCKFLIKDKTNISWAGQAVIRKDMNPKMLQYLKKAGCKRLYYGVESFSPKILKDMKKFCNNPEEIEKIIRSTKKAGITSCICLMPGFPTETNKDFFKNLKFIFRNRNFIDIIHINPCTVIEGTLLYKKPKKYSIYPIKYSLLWKSKNVNCFTRILRTLNLLVFIKILGIKVTVSI